MIFPEISTGCRGRPVAAMAALLGAAVSLAGCLGYPLVNNEIPISVTAGPVRIEDTFDKVSSLMTGLDYSITRAGTINGVALWNFTQACEPDFDKERCDEMGKKHFSVDEQIYHPGNGLAVNFYREPDSGEVIEVNFVIKEEGGAVTITGDFNDRKEAKEGNDLRFSKVALDDFSRIVASLKRSYGAEHVIAKIPS